MAGPRVLFASIGASLALVATAALSLLAVSAVFSFGGWSDSPSASIRQPALVFSGPESARSARQARSAGESDAVEPILVGASRSTGQRIDVGRAGGARPDRTRSARRPASRRPAEASATPALNPPAAQPAAPKPPAAAATTAAAEPASAGNNVRKLGEDVSSKVQQTGTALAQATAPLLPPISTAVQTVFNTVAALLHQTTGGVGEAVDALLPPKK
jgi:hypothetical protein